MKRTIAMVLLLVIVFSMFLTVSACAQCDEVIDGGYLPEVEITAKRTFADKIIAYMGFRFGIKSYVF